MSDRKIIWHKIAESVEELPWNEQGLCAWEVAGKRVCLVRHQERLYACAQSCPHAGGKMAQGYVDAVGNIVCPLHRYRFSLQNGRNVSGEGYYLKTYVLEQRADGLFLGLEQSRLFGF